MNSLKSFSDRELTGRLRQLVSKEQSLTLLILSHLAEVERRGLYLEKAYSTLTEYCVYELGYGDSSASRRVRAARVINKIPEVYDLLKENKLTFSAVVHVYSVLTPQNKDTLLPRLEGKSRKEIDMILTDYMPPRKIFDQAKPTLVKKLVAVERAPGGASSKSAAGALDLELGKMTRHSDGSKDPVGENSTPEMKEVLERMFEVRFAADEELMELIQWMRSHLSHKFPKGASFLDIFKYAMKYLKDHEDLALRKKPHKSSAKSDTRYIPKSVKQQVWKEYKGRCAYIGSNKKRCNSDFDLQFDHHPIPFGRGGPSTIDNLRLLCAKHNRHTAEKVYGERAIKKHYIKESGNRFTVKTGIHIRDTLFEPPERSGPSRANPLASVARGRPFQPPAKTRVASCNTSFP